MSQSSQLYNSREFAVKGISFDIDRERLQPWSLIDTPEQCLPWAASPAWLRFWRYVGCSRYVLKVKPTNQDAKHGYVGWEARCDHDEFRVARICEKNDSGLRLQYESGSDHLFRNAGLPTQTLEVTFTSRRDRLDFMQALVDHGFVKPSTDLSECSSISCEGGKAKLAPTVWRDPRLQQRAQACPGGAPAPPAKALPLAANKPVPAVKACPLAKRARVEAEASGSGDMDKEALRKERAMLLQEINELRSKAARMEAQKEAAEAKCAKLEAENRVLRASRGSQS